MGIRRHRKLLLFIVGMSVTLVAGVAFAGAVIVADDPVGDAEAPPSLAPKAGSRSLDINGTTPGGDPWAVEISESQTGKTCFFAGRVRDGKIGNVDADGTFRERNDAPSETCGDLNAEPALVGATAQDGVVAIHGVAGESVVSVSIGGDRVALGPRGGFIGVRSGESKDLPKWPVEVALKDGRQIVYPWTGPPETK